MKSLFLLGPLLFLVVSCNEFSERNVQENSQVATSPVIENQLLGNLEQINEGSFSREKMIANIGTFVVTPTVTNLKNEFNQFNVSYKQFCQSLNILSDLKPETLEQLRAPVQEYWKKTMIEYHRLASMNFGPGKDVSSTAMNSIYSYDMGTKCSLEQSVYQLAVNNRPVQFFKVDNYNRRGLGSIEHLIFSDPTKSVCPAKVLEDRNPNRVEFGDWFRMGLHQRQKDKCSYNLKLLEDISKKVDELYTAWSPNHQYFTSLMLGNNKSPVEWINQITAALFTLDTITKDQKITFPAGQDVMIAGENQNCGNVNCPNYIEHKFANFSLEAIKASVEGFYYLFFGINPINGTDGKSFDDFLVLRGFSEQAQNMKNKTEKLIERLDELSKTTTMKELLAVDEFFIKCMNSSSEKREVEVCSLIDDIRSITNFLKFELSAALQEVEVPKEASGDND